MRRAKAARIAGGWVRIYAFCCGNNILGRLINLFVESLVKSRPSACNAGVFRATAYAVGSYAAFIQTERR